jgi:hypothetical protein
VEKVSAKKIRLTPYYLVFLLVTNVRAVAQTNFFPFDRLRANGDMLKSCRKKLEGSQQSTKLYQKLRQQEGEVPGLEI